MIEIQNLNYGFYTDSKNITILDNLSLSVADSEKIAIVGKSGSGKSTLLSILAGIIPVNQGQVKIDGMELKNLNDKEILKWRKENVGFIFQHFHLISTLNVLENVMLPLSLLHKDNPRKYAQEILDKVGLGSRLSHFPHELSGGECQRVAIARALVHRPKLILADEPSGSLDVETGNEVMKLLFQIVKDANATLVLVTHDSELANALDRKLLLSHGKFQ